MGFVVSSFRVARVLLMGEAVPKTEVAMRKQDCLHSTLCGGRCAVRIPSGAPSSLCTKGALNLALSLSPQMNGPASLFGSESYIGISSPARNVFGAGPANMPLSTATSLVSRNPLESTHELRQACQLCFLKTGEEPPGGGAASLGNSSQEELEQVAAAPGSIPKGPVALPRSSSAGHQTACRVTWWQS